MLAPDPLHVIVTAVEASVFATHFVRIHTRVDELPITLPRFNHPDGTVIVFAFDACDAKMIANVGPDTVNAGSVTPPTVDDVAPLLAVLEARKATGTANP